MRELLLARGLPVSLDGRRVDAVLEAIARDKKRLGADVPFVLVEAPGEVSYRLRGRRARICGRPSRSWPRERRGLPRRGDARRQPRPARPARPALYGTLTLPELERRIEQARRALGLSASFFQTNHEGDFVEHLHALAARADAILLNPGAWTHYAWAIRDALEIAALPAVEIHLSDVAGARAVAARLGDRRAVLRRRSPGAGPTATARRSAAARGARAGRRRERRGRAPRASAAPAPERLRSAWASAARRAARRRRRSTCAT